MNDEPKDLAYRARALAQTHPLTPLAKRFIDRVAAQERTTQPLAETAIWASTALLTGYCVRRVEEADADLVLGPSPGDDPDLDSLDTAASEIAGRLRDEGSLSPPHPDEHRGPTSDAMTVAALDRIIGSEVERRLGNWGDKVDAQAWSELADYVTWCVVKGYALRVAEMATGALA